ncbi:uncharacterized protein LOC135828718 [Sycon ciliatum]|uniref:uncharacterized protein LOC135828718 n=1 Tax=Sycon ciliatum TaxID=27933 RepID=UPI0031F6CA1D
MRLKMGSILLLTLCVLASMLHTINCAEGALWTTVRHHDKYYLSTFNDEQWVQYDVARRACAFHGQRLLSESDMPESVLKSLQLRPGAYFLDGGKKIVTQNYEEGSNRVILEIFKLYPGTKKQILCIQICDHGQLVKGRCICQDRYFGETCEKSRDYYYFCDAKRWLYMDTKDKVVYDSAKNFCNIRGASIPTDAEETCMTELATQVHKHIGQVHFWATRLADGNPLAFNGHGVLAPAIPTHKFNIACVDRRGESHYVCDANRVLFMHTRDLLGYDSANKFCTDRGASLPTVNEEPCMKDLSSQLHKTEGDLYFWTTRPAGGKPFASNGVDVLTSQKPTNKFNVACVQRRICQRPKDPAYGSYSNGVFLQQEYLDTLTLTCEQGYEVQGNPKVTCITAPSTTTPLATCAKICQKPSIPNGIFNGDAFNSAFGNNELRGVCNDGYTATQTPKATCGNFGTVTVMGKCEPVQCDRPITQAGAYSNFANGVFNTEQSNITLTCNSSYWRLGSAQATCEKNGTVSGLDGGCAKIILCQKPSLPNGIFKGDAFNSARGSNELRGVCNDGYTATQTPKANCDIFGTVTVMGKCEKRYGLGSVLVIPCQQCGMENL